MQHLGRYPVVYVFAYGRRKAVIAWMVWSRIGKWDIIPEKSRFKRKVIKQGGNNNQTQVL